MVSDTFAPFVVLGDFVQPFKMGPWPVVKTHTWQLSIHPYGNTLLEHHPLWRRCWQIFPLLVRPLVPPSVRLLIRLTVRPSIVLRSSINKPMTIIVGKYESRDGFGGQERMILSGHFYHGLPLREDASSSSRSCSEVARSRSFLRTSRVPPEQIVLQFRDAENAIWFLR